MDWVKLRTNYWLDVAIVRAGEAAEVLWTRAKAYCGGEENGGFVPRELLPRLTPARGPARARALVREGLWEVVDGGWQFVDWDQVTREQLEAQREAGRARQAAFRQRRNGRGDGVTHAKVTEERREEVEGDAAAAAALPGPIDVLRAKLQAHTPLRGLRFDDLDQAKADQLVALLELHGDQPLVDVAIATCRNPAPVHVSAFLKTWAALPTPGTRLGVVRGRPQRCTTHPHQEVSPAGICSLCASEALAGGDR